MPLDPFEEQERDAPVFTKFGPFSVFNLRSRAAWLILGIIVVIAAVIALNLPGPESDPNDTQRIKDMQAEATAFAERKSR